MNCDPYWLILIIWHCLVKILIIFKGGPRRLPRMGLHKSSPENNVSAQLFYQELEIKQFEHDVSHHLEVPISTVSVAIISHFGLIWQQTLNKRWPELTEVGILTRIISFSKTSRTKWNEVHQECDFLPQFGRFDGTGFHQLFCVFNSSAVTFV